MAYCQIPTDTNTAQAYPAGNRPAANYNLLFKDDFSSGTVGSSYSGFHASTVYANDHPFLQGKAQKVNLGTMTPQLVVVQ